MNMVKAELWMTLSVALTPSPAGNLQFSGNLTNKTRNFIRRRENKVLTLCLAWDLWFYQSVNQPDEPQEILLQLYLPKPKKKKDQSS